MSIWPRYPRIYEINTWVWLSELSSKNTGPVDLGNVPGSEWDAIASYGFDAVWLMGVWERSPQGTAIANLNRGQIETFQKALPDYQPADNVGSPYCVRRYIVDRNLGGPQGLAAARRALASRGLALILDFVPNHVAPDHPWVENHPEYFIQGSADDVKNDPTSFIEINGKTFACGRDPYFPAWQDVLQLNAFNPGLRQSVKETLLSLGGQCDGIRCDMAMLLLNSIFQRTWGSRAGDRPETEYWTELIATVKRVYPEFLFIAEAYWDLEWELQQQGFDFCYDKRLYDRLEHSSAEDIRLHLCADLGYQQKLLRFLENHDEPRAGSAFSSAKQKAAAITVATLPGARLFHEGQFEGRKVRLPVFLARRPQEPVDAELQVFYRTLLEATDRSVFREGGWRLCDRYGWPDNSSYLNLVAWTWTNEEDRYLIIVNLSDQPSQARVRVTDGDMKGKACQLVDLLTGAAYERDMEELGKPGLYVDLGPWQSHLFQCHQTRQGSSFSSVASTKRSKSWNSF